MPKQIVGAVKRNGRTYWNRIGTAFESNDGSWKIKLDYFPSDRGFAASPDAVTAASRVEMGAKCAWTPDR